MGALRWLTRGAASAAGSDMPKSTWFRMICRMVVGIVDPPAAPTLKTGCPSRNAMTGPMLDRGCLPPAGRLGSVAPADGGAKSKSVISLLSRKP